MGREIFDDEHRPALPDHKEHHCTDPIFLVLFFLAVGGMVYTQVYAYEHGNRGNLFNGINYEGKVCGINTEGSYLYWCKDAFGKLAFAAPICVESCPTNKTGQTTTTDCFDPDTQHLTRIDAYPTKPVGPLCLPQSADLKKKIEDKVLGGDQIQPALRSIWDAKILIASSGVVGIAIGYAYLFLLSMAAKPLVKASMVFMIVGPFCLGAYWIYTGLFPPETGLFRDSQSDFIWGGSAMFISLVFVLVACCFLSGLDTATRIVEASCECMFAEATLLLEPFIALVVKVITLVIMCSGLLALLSCGKVMKTGNAGVLRTWELSTEEKVYLGYSFFIMIWMLELGTSVSQYVLAWATQLWYFTPNDANGEKQNIKPCAIFLGYINCLRYHMGTCAVGSLLIASLRCLRYVMTTCARLAEAEGNCIGACIAKVCICCITCAKEVAMMVTKTAYMHVAITSEDFLHSAKSAMGIIAEEVPVIAILNGAQSVFMILGIGIITVVPAGLTWIACTRLPPFSEDEFAKHAMVAALASAVFNAVIGASFMLVFDTVGDTILYCFAMDERRNTSFQGMFTGGYDSETSEEGDDEPGFFGWLFGSSEEVKEKLSQFEHQVLDPRVEYAPRKLRDLIEEHKREHGLS